MIKLKDIISELDLRSGHAGGNESIGYLYRVLAGVSSAPREIGTKIFDEDFLLKFRNVFNVGGNRAEMLRTLTWTPEIIANIKKESVWSSGDVHLLTAATNAVERDYYLVDISREKIADAFCGMMNTRAPQNDVINEKFLGLPGEEIHWSHVNEKGRGYGAMLYDGVLSTAKVLFSDNILFKGSLMMWTHHMKKKAGFLGAVLTQSGQWNEDGPVVIPIDPELVKPNELKRILEQRVARFVSVDSSFPLPKTIRRFAHNMRGVNPLKELGVITLSVKVKSKTFETMIEESDSLVSLIENIQDNSSRVPRRMKLHMNRTPVLPKPLKNIKLLICILSDAVILVKNTGSGVSAQIMD